MAVMIQSMRGASGMSGSVENLNHATPKVSVQQAPFTLSAVSGFGGSFSLSSLQFQLVIIKRNLNNASNQALQDRARITFHCQ